MPLNSESLIESVPSKGGEAERHIPLLGDQYLLVEFGEISTDFSTTFGEGLRRANGRGKERNRVPLTAPLVRVAPPTWRFANQPPSSGGQKRVARSPKAGSSAINVLGPDGWIPHPQSF